MRGINHPAIVKLLSFSESDEYYYLVLERTQERDPVRHTMLTPECSDGGRRALPPNVRTGFLAVMTLYRALTEVQL